MRARNRVREHSMARAAEAFKEHPLFRRSRDSSCPTGLAALPITSLLFVQCTCKYSEEKLRAGFCLQTGPGGNEYYALSGEYGYDRPLPCCGCGIGWCL
jgi:hypothetical protein